MERTAIPMWLTAVTGVTMPSFELRRDRAGSPATGRPRAGRPLIPPFAQWQLRCQARRGRRNRTNSAVTAGILARGHPREAMKTGPDPHTDRTGTHRTRWQRTVTTG